MSEEEIRFLPFEEASRIVGAIQEEEDIEDPDHRIFTVYSKENKELCWFDYNDVISEINPGKGDTGREMVTEYILNRIPDWVLDL